MLPERLGVSTPCEASDFWMRLPQWLAPRCHGSGLHFGYCVPESLAVSGADVLPHCLCLDCWCHRFVSPGSAPASRSAVLRKRRLQFAEPCAAGNRLGARAPSPVDAGSAEPVPELDSLALLARPISSARSLIRGLSPHHCARHWSASFVSPRASAFVSSSRSSRSISNHRASKANQALQTNAVLRASGALAESPAAAPTPKH